jgi:hypothetical protein
MKLRIFLSLSAVCIVLLAACPGGGGGDDTDLEKVAAPAISPNGGHFEGSASVVMTCATADAVIHYTLDGTAPTAASPVYSGAVTVDDTITVKAIAVKTGMADSDVAVSSPFYIAKWRLLGSAGISVGEARHMDIAMGTDNLPVVIYSDAGDGWKAYAKKWNGTAWTGLGDAPLSSGVANYTALAVHGTDVYATFQQTTTSATKIVFLPPSANVLTCGIAWNGSTWNVLGTPPLSNLTSYNSIAVGSDGFPFVVYCDASYYDSFPFNTGLASRWNGSAWELLDGLGFSSNGTAYTDICLDSSNVPVVVFKDPTNAGKATVKKWNSGGSNWVTIGLAGFSAGTADYTNIAIGSDDVPYVVYKDGSADGKATVMKYNDTESAWEALGGAGISAGAADYTCIAIDSTGKPWIACKDGEAGGKATVLKWTGTAWEPVGGGTVSVDTASYLNIAFAADGSFYIVFQDGLGGKATVMRYGE